MHVLIFISVYFICTFSLYIQYSNEEEKFIKGNISVLAITLFR